MLRDYSALPKVTIHSLRKDFEAMDMFPESALKLARFIIEPRRDARLVVDEERWMSLKDVAHKLDQLIGDYHVYSSEDEQAFKRGLLDKVGGT